MERLTLDQEGEDLQVVLLAAATKASEALPLLHIVISRYCGEGSTDREFIVGKYVALLHDAYVRKSETIESLDLKISRLYYLLGYPNWLVMLSRNCEYATDMPPFEEPFESEFAYIASLWNEARDRADFESKYRREISNQHDIKYF